MSVRNTEISPHTTRRAFLTGSAAFAAGLALYSGEIARHEITTTHRTIQIRNLPSAFHGIRIAQISDIHIDEYTEPYFLEEVVRHVNTIAPDIILLTGDFVTRGAFSFVASNHAANRCAEILRTLHCPEKYAILGNHDVSVGAELVVSALNRQGIPVLRNAALPLTRGGDRLWLGGTADPGTEHPDLYRAVPANPGAPVLLMVHAPDYADTVVAHPRGPLVDLMLAGHSHGGQIRLPVVGALVLPPLGKKYVEGLFQLGSMQLYVNRGIGSVGLPFRLNCPPEITIFTLDPA